MGLVEDLKNPGAVTNQNSKPFIGRVYSTKPNAKKNYDDA